MRTTLTIIMFVFLMVSCKTIEDAGCIKEANKNIEIRWGNVDMLTKDMKGYALSTKAELFKTSTVPGYSEFDYEKIGIIPQDEYCEMFKKIRKEFLKTQTLYNPGETARYVEYFDKKSRVKLRAFWNPKFETFWSEGFRHIYDELQQLIKKAE